MLYDGKFKAIEIDWKNTLVCPINSIIGCSSAIEIFKQFIEKLFSSENFEGGFNSDFNHDSYNRILSGIRETIIEAAREKKLLSMEYHNKTRIIESYSFKYQKGNENFFGWDLTRGNHIKCFHLHKISGVSILPKTYEPKYPVEI